MLCQGTHLPPAQTSVGAAYLCHHQHSHYVGSQGVSPLQKCQASVKSLSHFMRGRLQRSRPSFDWKFADPLSHTPPTPNKEGPLLVLTPPPPPGPLFVSPSRGEGGLIAEWQARAVPPPAPVSPCHQPGCLPLGVQGDAWSRGWQDCSSSSSSSRWQSDAQRHALWLLPRANSLPNTTTQWHLTC
jgi:hypothetical protein